MQKLFYGEDRRANIFCPEIRGGEEAPKLWYKYHGNLARWGERRERSFVKWDLQTLSYALLLSDSKLHSPKFLVAPFYHYVSMSVSFTGHWVL